jgi:hypothetical protein
MAKILTWLAVNGASVIGMVQAVLKFVKELATAIINLTSILAPEGKAQDLVIKVRGIVEKVDAFVEKYKSYILK